MALTSEHTPISAAQLHITARSLDCRGGAAAAARNGRALNLLYRSAPCVTNAYYIAAQATG